MDNFRFKLRIFFVILGTVIVLTLLFLAIVPFGDITYTYNFQNKSDFISKLNPQDRLGEIRKGIQKVVGAPVYFTLRTPRRFEEAELILKYRSEGDISLIEAGVLVDDVVWQYNLKGIENKLISRLHASWDSFFEDDVLFLQRKEAKKKYNSLSDFSENLPKLEKIALYNHDLNIDFLIDGYEKLNDIKVIENDILADYQFYTYIKDEDLYFNFFFSDLNKNKDSDEVDLIVYYGNEEIERKHLDDDGITKDNKEMSGERNIELFMKNLPEGFYKISVRANDDIVTKRIITRQSKVSFVNKIYLAKNDNCLDCKNNIFTDSGKIQAKTIYPDRLQNLLVKEIFSPRSSYADEIIIDETYKQFESKFMETPISEIIMEKDGIILTGDGVFAFDLEGLASLRIKRADGSFDIDKKQVDYVLANYKLPKKIDDFFEAKANFDLRGVYSDNGKYSFIISVPGLKADDDVFDYIEIKEIEIKLKGKSLWQKIFGK